MKKNKPLKVSIVMGSQSDYNTMQLAEKTLKKIGVSFETKIISAHRTPKRMYDYAVEAEHKGLMPSEFATRLDGIAGSSKDNYNSEILSDE